MPKRAVIRGISDTEVQHGVKIIVSCEQLEVSKEKVLLPRVKIGKHRVKEEAGHERRMML